MRKDISWAYGSSMPNYSKSCLKSSRWQPNICNWPLRWEAELRMPPLICEIWSYLSWGRASQNWVELNWRAHSWHLRENPVENCLVHGEKPHTSGVRTVILNNGRDKGQCFWDMFAPVTAYHSAWLAFSLTSCYPVSWPLWTLITFDNLKDQHALLCWVETCPRMLCWSIWPSFIGNKILLTVFSNRAMYDYFFNYFE